MCSEKIKGTVEQGTQFYYTKLLDYPFESAKIEYTVMYNYTTAMKRCPTCYVWFDIYTTADHINFETKCSTERFGQLRNTFLNMPLRPGKTEGGLNCAFYGTGNEVINCTGTRFVQDFVAVTYGFSFGVHCDTLRYNYLPEVMYNVLVSDVTNETHCIPTEEKKYGIHCSKFYINTTQGDLIGNPNLDSLFAFPTLFRAIDSSAQGICYQYLEEAFCHVLFPKCDPINKIMIPLCREMCYNFMWGCEMFLPQLWAIINLSDVQSLFNCGYLPSKKENISCFYKPVVCENPPNVENAFMESVDISVNNTYYGMSKVSYRCSSASYEIAGNSSITCLYSGNWSKVPVCKRKPNKAKQILAVLTSVLCPFLVR